MEYSVKKYAKTFKLGGQIVCSRTVLRYINKGYLPTGHTVIRRGGKYYIDVEPSQSHIESACKEFHRYRIQNGLNNRQVPIEVLNTLSMKYNIQLSVLRNILCV